MRSSSAFSIKGLVTSRRAVAAASCVASFAIRVLRCTCNARYSTDKTTAIEPINCEIALIASQSIYAVIAQLNRCVLLWFVSDFEDDLTACVTGCHLWLGWTIHHTSDIGEKNNK